MVLSRLLQGHISGNDINDIDAVPDPAYKIIGEHVIFSAPQPLRPHRLQAAPLAG